MAFSRSNVLRSTSNLVMPVQIDITKTGVNFNTLYRAGQFLRWVDADKRWVPATLSAHGPNVGGIAEFTQPPESQPGGPNEEALNPRTMRTSGDIVQNGKSGETYLPGDEVEIDDAQADGQSVRLVSGGSGNSANAVGRVCYDIPTTGIVVTASRQQVPFHLIPKRITGGTDVIR